MNRILAERMRPIRDEVYLLIRKAIIRGDYKSGERLQEEQLAKELGVSRTPVREALRKLEVEKMVVHYPHKGTVVSDVAVNELEDLYEIRRFVETIIAKRAARYATQDDIRHLNLLLDQEESATEPDDILDCIDDYNAAIFDAGNCPNIADISAKVRENLGRMIGYGHLRPDRRVNAQKEHRAIVQAIAAHDEELAKELTMQHLTNASSVVAEFPVGNQRDEAGENSRL